MNCHDFGGERLLPRGTILSPKLSLVGLITRAAPLPSSEAAPFQRFQCQLGLPGDGPRGLADGLMFEAEQPAKQCGSVHGDFL